MTLEKSEERADLLKAGFRGNEIEKLYLIQNKFAIKKDNVLKDALQKHPDGRTCAHCKYYMYCSRLIERQGDEDICDWEPSKFTAKKTEDIVCL